MPSSMQHRDVGDRSEMQARESETTAAKSHRGRTAATTLVKTLETTVTSQSDVGRLEETTCTSPLGLPTFEYTGNYRST